MEENSSQTSSIQVQQHTIGHHQANSYALSRNYQSTNQETPSYYYDTGIHGSMTSGNHPTHTMHYVPAQPMARSYPDEQVYMQQNVYDYQPQSGGMFHQHPQTSHQVPVPQTGHPEQVLQSYSYNNNSHVAKSFESSPTLQASSTIPQGIEDDQSSGGGGGNTSQGKTSDKSNLYKTELCRKWTQTGFCRYGDKCQFAHGLYELRATVKHPLYKTTPCKSFQAHGTCRYGNRCRFIHDESEYELAHVPRGVPAQNLSVDTTSGRASLVPVGPASQSFPSPTLSPESVSDSITMPQQQQYQLPRKEVGSPVLAARSRSMAPGSPSVQSSRRSSTVQRTSPPGSPASRPIGIHGAIHRVPSAPASMGIVHSQSVPEHFASEFSSLSIQSSPMSSQMKQRQQLQNHYGSSGSARSPLLRPSHSYQSLETHAEYPPQQSRSPHNTRGEFGETLLHSASTQSLSSHFAGHQQSSSVGKSGSLPRPPLVGRGMTNSASFSERILPSFCLPLAPKMGYARQSSMTQLASLGRTRDDDDTANARLEATAKAFGRPSLDLNSNTFSSPEIDHPQLQQSNDQSVSTPLGSQRSLNSNKDSEANNNTSKDRMMWETMFQAAPGAWDDTPYTQQATSSSPMNPTPEGPSARPSF